MKGMLAPKYKEVIQGKVEIRQVMKFSKALVAGSYVLEGKVCNNSKSVLFVIILYYTKVRLNLYVVSKMM